MSDHHWKVAVQQRQFVNVVDKWQSFVSRGNRLLDDVEVHSLTFTADEQFVQLACTRCGTHAAAENKMPISGPMDSHYWRTHPCD